MELTIDHSSLFHAGSTYSICTALLHWDTYCSPPALLSMQVEADACFMTSVANLTTAYSFSSVLGVKLGRLCLSKLVCNTHDMWMKCYTHDRRIKLIIYTTCG